MRTGKTENPTLSSRISLYILAKELHISPAEAYAMPYTLVRDLLTIHGVMKEKEMQQYDKVKSSVK
tara:strand:- start:6960 stop:7157 length:198 start_codon:yes stop_codon:yes gene_type:complete